MRLNIRRRHLVHQPGDREEAGFVRFSNVRILNNGDELRSALDADWAARPVSLAPRGGRMTLVLENPGGEPLDRLLGRPIEVTSFLRIAIALVAAFSIATDSP